MRIREASVEDALAIAHVHVASWRVAYQGLLPQAHLDELDEGHRAEVWARLIRSEDARTRTYVAESGGEIIGFANAGPSRDSDTPTSGEIPAIYIHPDSWGIGVGRALIAAARAWLVEAGFGRASLWVLADNDHARRFYETDGWRPDGTVKHDDSRGFALVEVRYDRQLP